MKTIRIKDSVYDELKKVASIQKVGMEKLLTEALNNAVISMKERHLLELYRGKNITLAKAAELLSIDIWEMIEKVRKADIHIDYGEEELREDLNL